ncbi:FHA domain-containing protein [Xylanimonas protaetiae]|uniref:FHA domain-containing protein n=1 Tax=Xylanimonas protaetiae TaxID=2509457 RepID=A0A4P6FBE5_9MICO|nr:FHA domain-containing protein [Xylanimonas protaetiae]QAY70787.1 FHA domain-containing protein [Xylanimonas protaetiae]
MPDLDTPDVNEPRPGTTHAAYGAGNPRLMLGNDGWMWEGERQRFFPITREVTTIGSAPDADLRLEGIAAAHAEIRHDERDDYVLHLNHPGTAPTAAGGHNVDTPGDQPLHAGATFTVGEWTLTFERDEFADHGRPFGGREGGEGSDQPPQPARPDYRHAHEATAGQEAADDANVDRPQGDLAKDEQAVGE